MFINALISCIYCNLEVTNSSSRELFLIRLHKMFDCDKQCDSVAQQAAEGIAK